VVEFSVSMEEESFNLVSIATNNDFPKKKEECKKQESDY